MPSWIPPHLDRTGRADDPQQAHRLAGISVVVEAGYLWLDRVSAGWAMECATLVPMLGCRVVGSMQASSEPSMKQIALLGTVPRGSMRQPSADRMSVMYRLRLLAVRHARSFERLYGILERTMIALDPVFARTALSTHLVRGADGARSNVARAEVPGGDTIPYVIAYHEIIAAPDTGHNW
jgi:hypothetical protein